MKKNLIVLLILLLCLCSCGKKENANNEEKNPEENQSETIQVDEGLFDVTITLPNSFFESFDTTAEKYVNSMNSENGDKFKKIEINDDNSVSITMTKAKHNELMSELEKSLDETLQEMINDDTYSIVAVEHDKKFENFKVELSTNEVGFAESFLTLAFSMYGGLYQLFDGNQDPHVVVKYIGSDGTELQTWDSKDN